MPTATGGFVDIGLSDLVGAYTEIEKSKNAAASKNVEDASANQDQTLHSPGYDSASDAISGGNAQVPGAAQPTVRSYWDRIPKPLLYGSAAFLGFGLLLKAAKG